MSGRLQSVLDVPPETQQVPVETVTDGNRTVGETMDFLDFEFLPVEKTGEHAAAGRSDVSGKMDRRGITHRGGSKLQRLNISLLRNYNRVLAKSSNNDMMMVWPGMATHPTEPLELNQEKQEFK